MDWDDDDFDDFVEFVYFVRAPKQYIRDAINPVEYFNNLEFKRRYRFSKEIINNVLLPIVQDALVKGNRRGLPISPLFQLLVALRYYATANLQVSRVTILIVLELELTYTFFSLHNQ